MYRIKATIKVRLTIHLGYCFLRERSVLWSIRSSMFNPAGASCQSYPSLFLFPLLCRLLTEILKVWWFDLNLFSLVENTSSVRVGTMYQIGSAHFAKVEVKSATALGCTFWNVSILSGSCFTYKPKTYCIWCRNSANIECTKWLGMYYDLILIY